MNELQYHQIIEDSFNFIDQCIDVQEADIDSELHSGVLNLEFENRTQMVINKQEPLLQLWLATKFGGFHFERHDDKWICNRSGNEFWSFLAESIEKQSGVVLNLDGHPL
ncbi:iron donor protein CyaY [Alginatibacterium sediminis]|uniref:Iron-sulfur cluster assembly protein CyaY n=1 Tax=Alginatibacterium sediminis TaxID=2164068 RepID=A0A420EN40_9ALTE|nr:iron donor protein CyaY [Alginatibacterium sediminis]RKF22100.1 iron donor protein CyaY [Alginatibacterium sediminis]